MRAISTDIICQTIVQHCRTSDLELTATCCGKLRLSIYFQIQTENSSVFYCFLLNILPACSVSAPVTAYNGIMALYKSRIIIIIFVIIADRPSYTVVDWTVDDRALPVAAVLVSGTNYHVSSRRSQTSYFAMV